VTIRIGLRSPRSRATSSDWVAPPPSTRCFPRTHRSPTRDTGFSGSGGAPFALSSSGLASSDMPLIVFDCKGIPTTRRERIETAVGAAGGHVKEP
jgi:hypothetical protein